jgi:hypothetical protein
MWLLQKPSPEFQKNIDTVKAAIAWDSYDFVNAIQYRAWSEVSRAANPLIKSQSYIDSVDSCFLNNVEAYVRSLPANVSVLFFVTSESAEVTKSLQIRIRNRLASIHDNVHVAYNGLFVSTHSAQTQDHVSNAGMIDWYLVGEAQDCVCTGSTFCIGARARPAGPPAGPGPGRGVWVLKNASLGAQRLYDDAVLDVFYGASASAAALGEQAQLEGELLFVNQASQRAQFLPVDIKNLPPFGSTERATLPHATVVCPGSDNIQHTAFGLSWGKNGTTR